MNIKYTAHGRARRLKFVRGVWSGTDKELVALLNENPHAVVGRHEYYPVPWYLAKAVADALGGTLDAPEPFYLANARVVYSPSRQRLEEKYSWRDEDVIVRDPTPEELPVAWSQAKTDEIPLRLDERRGFTDRPHA